MKDVKKHPLSFKENLKMGIIWNTIFNVVDAFILLITFTYLNKLYGFARKNFIKVIIYVSLYVLILSFTEFMIPQGIRQLFNILFLSLLLSFITKTSLYASIITNALTSIYLFTVEIAVLFIFMLVMRMDIETLTSTQSTRIMCGIAAKGLELVSVIILINSGFKIKKLSEFKKPNTLFQLMALQTLIIAILIICVSSVDSYKSNFMLYNAFVVVVYLLLLGLTLIDFKERERLQAIQNRFRVQEEYINNIENMLTIIRREKHDFANHLNTILAMCTLNKPDTVAKIGSYINKLSGKLINAYHFYNTGNDYVDGMLAVKSNLAFERDINLDADFKASLKNLLMNDCDITSIIGNIIDNAFEAILADCSTTGRYINISTYEDSFFYNISISNNGPVISEKDIDKIFNNGYSTKASNKPDHGFGLYIVQQLVLKHDGVITVTSTEEKTEFLIKFLKEGKVYGKTG